MQQLIDISWLPGPQQQTRRMLLQRSIAGTDRQKDTVPLSRPFCVLCGDIPWSQPGAAMPMSPVSPGDRQADGQTLYRYYALLIMWRHTLIAAKCRDAYESRVSGGQTDRWTDGHCRILCEQCLQCDVITSPSLIAFKQRLN